MSDSWVVVVDGETFVVRDGEMGGTHFDWVTGPNEGYGFSSSAPRRFTQGHDAGPATPEERDASVRSIANFLSMIDPATGYIGPD